MEIFEYSDYKKIVLEWVRIQPRRGHGQFRRISEYLGLNTVSVSQIFTGSRELAPEQAFKLAKYLSLTPLETDFFVLLVQIARAGSEDYRVHLRAQAEKLRIQSRELRNRIPQQTVLTEEAKAIFYSRWTYSAIRLASAIPGLHSVDQLAVHLDLPRPVVAKCADFLLRHGLCEMRNGEIHMASSWTHLESDSPFISARQISWRLKGFEKIDVANNENLFFTSPVVLSRSDFERFRRELLKFITEFRALVEPSSSQELACLNIDWFKV